MDALKTKKNLQAKYENEAAKPKPRALLSPTENMAVGALGGALETCLHMPLLTYKFCRQEGRKFPTKISSWYRGVAVQAGTVAPITAIQFMINGVLQKMALGGEVRELTSSESIFTAAGAGAISAVVYTPVDLVTIQQQKMSLNPIGTVQAIIKNYGINGMFRGLVSCAVRESIYTAGYLGLAPVITHYLTKEVDMLREKPLASNIAGACVAGSFAALVTHPVDTAKTCVQSDLSKRTWPSVRATMPILMKEGGIGCFFRGVVPRTLRICGAFFVCASIREMAIDYKTLNI